MYCRRGSLFFSLLLVTCFLHLCSAVKAADDAAELVPGSTIFYAEITSPAQIIEGFLEHPLTKKLQQEDAYKALMQEPKMAEVPVILKYVESQLGMKWDEALKALTKHGVTIAFDAKSKGIVLLLKAKDKKSLDKIVETMLELARADAKEKNQEDPYDVDEYRGITTYGVKEGGFATYENWFVFVNNEKVGRTILDNLLEEQKDSLATNPQFQEARKKKKRSDAGWMYIDLKTIRDAGLAKKLFSGKADDPFGEIILGGILEALKETPYATARAFGNGEKFQVQLSIPFERSSVSEQREHYFGPRAAGQANDIPEVPEMLFAVSAYRNFSEMWLRAGDLFNERINDKIAEADSTLTTLFSGKDFGEDILAALSPEVLVVVSRQKFSQNLPVPAIKLPAFAIVAEMKDPKATSREFRRLFNSLIGFFNVIGSMNGQPQLDLDFDKNEYGQWTSATFAPTQGEEKKQDAKINFNFSPTIAFAGNRVIVSSTTNLAREMITVKQKENMATENTVNTTAELSAPVLKSVLDDNRDHLISKNMLEEGHSREEAENEIGLLLNLIGYFQSTSLSLETSGNSLELNINLEVAK